MKAMAVSSPPLKKKPSPTTNKINGADGLKIYYLSDRQAKKKKKGLEIFQWCQWICRHFLQCATTAETNHNYFIHISLPKYISFIITNFGTLIL